MITNDVDEFAAKLRHAGSHRQLVELAASEIANRVCAKLAGQGHTHLNWAGVRDAARDEILAGWKRNARHLWIGYLREASAGSAASRDCDLCLYDRHWCPSHGGAVEHNHDCEGS